MDDEITSEILSSQFSTKSDASADTKNFDKLSLYNYIFPEHKTREFVEDSPLLVKLKEKKPPTPTQSEASDKPATSPKRKKSEQRYGWWAAVVGVHVLLVALIIYFIVSGSNADWMPPGPPTHYAVVIRAATEAELFVYSFVNYSSLLYLDEVYREGIKYDWFQTRNPRVFKEALDAAVKFIPSSMHPQTPLKLYASHVGDSDLISRTTEFFVEYNFSLSETPVIDDLNTSNGTLLWISIVNLERKNIPETKSIALLFGDPRKYVHSVFIKEDCKTASAALISPFGELCLDTTTESFGWLFNESYSKPWIDACVHPTSEYPHAGVSINPDPSRDPSLEACESELSEYGHRACDSFGKIPQYVEKLYVIYGVLSEHGRITHIVADKGSFLSQVRAQGTSVCKSEAKDTQSVLDCASLAYMNNIIQCLDLPETTLLDVPDTFARGHEADSMHGAAVKAIFQMSPLKKEAPEEATEEAPQEATEEAPEEPQKKERRSQRRKSRRNGRKKKA